MSESHNLQAVKPLEPFDFKTIQEPLEGLLRNTDSDLARRIKANQLGNFTHVSDLMLLLTVFRVAANSYRASMFLISDVDTHDKRLPEYVLTLAPINRQIMDLWFSLVYIADDFSVRSHEYELGAYRELRKNIADSRKKYGGDSDWQNWFQDMDALLKQMEVQIPITAEQKADPEKTIAPWPNPHALTKRKTASQDFLIFLHDLIYGDISIEAHMKPAGLVAVAGFLLRDLAGEDVRKTVEGRTIHQYKFKTTCRVVTTLLGITSEIELLCGLGNAEQIAKIWRRLAEKNSDTKDCFEARYKAKFNVA